LTPRTGWVCLFFLAAVAGASILASGPPAPVGPDAPEAVFSSTRAMAHVVEIAKAPHPMGSEESARVRGYIVTELGKLGLTAGIQKGDIVAVLPHRVESATVLNILVRIPGTASTAPVMLASHYDSVPAGPGAGDDGAAVAAMLETVRALRTGPPLRNDLILLFTDGEEGGLLGARVFRSHPWSTEPGIVLNFEGRGSAGPVYMFQSSRPNGWMIRELAKAAPHPVASSLMAEVYRRMPNDTDLTIFMEGGLDGLNFAFVDGSRAYHTDLDTADNLSEASLMHHGSYMLSLARHFGNLDLTQKSREQVVYFDIAGRGLVVYPEDWNWPLFAGLAVFSCFVLWVAARRSVQRAKGVVGGAALMLLSIVLTAMLVWGLTGLLVQMLGDDLRLPVGSTGGDHWFFAAFALAAVAMTAKLTSAFAGRLGPFNLGMGALLWWILLLVGSAIAMPGATFFFQWPAACAAAGLLLFVLFARDGESTPAATIACALCAAGAVVLLAPLVYGFFVSLGLRGSYIPAAITVLATGTFLPVIAATRTAKFRVPMVATVACAACLTVGWFSV